MSDFNHQVLQAVYRAAKEVAKPIIIGGGFNLEPQELAASGSLNALKLKAVTPVEGTCRPGGRIIDYWVISATFGAAEAKVLHGWNLAPHFPVQLRVDGNTFARNMRIMEIPKRLPCPLPT
eukprot:3068639-Pyramimonas_sp.AAC.1